MLRIFLNGLAQETKRSRVKQKYLMARLKELIYPQNNANPKLAFSLPVFNIVIDGLLSSVPISTFFVSVNFACSCQ